MTTTRTNTAAAVNAPDAGGPGAEHGAIAANSPPSAVGAATNGLPAGHADMRLEVLRLARRLRRVRAIDVAATLFPGREVKAATSAAQRIIRRLVSDGMMTRSRTVSGLMFYGLTRRGADALRDDAPHDAREDAAEPAPKRSPPRFDHAVTSPRTRQAQIRLEVLRLANRFRQVRAIDAAAALFAEREFKAALSAAQRAIGRLVRDRMMTRYRSLSGQTYYGLAKRGADLLRENAADNGEDGRAEASASRACEKTNPEHGLWSAFAVAACEARGMQAFTERELLPRFAAGPDSPRRFPLVYVGDDGKRKGLMPDAIALERDGRGVVWFEIDRSGRGSVRLDDLVGLVRQLGNIVDLGDGSQRVLRRVVVWCKTLGILRRNRTHLTGPVVLKRGPVPRVRIGNSDDPAIRPRGEDVYDLLKDFEVRLADNRIAIETKVAGQIHLQLLPTHLPSYSYRHGKVWGWFDDGSLPYRLPDRRWPAPRKRTFDGS